MHSWFIFPAQCGTVSGFLVMLVFLMHSWFIFPAQCGTVSGFLVMLVLLMHSWFIFPAQCGTVSAFLVMLVLLMHSWFIFPAQCGTVSGFLVMLVFLMHSWFIPFQLPNSYSTLSPYVPCLSQHVQSGKWTSFGKRVWFTKSHIILVIFFFTYWFIYSFYPWY